jgi:hypothetical protein
VRVASGLAGRSAGWAERIHAADGEACFAKAHAELLPTASSNDLEGCPALRARWRVVKLVELDRCEDVARGKGVDTMGVRVQSVVLRHVYRGK